MLLIGKGGKCDNSGLCGIVQGTLEPLVTYNMITVYCIIILSKCQTSTAD